MRVARERLIFFALSVLMTWAERAAKEPIQPDMSVRLALAFLFTCGRSKDRRSYDAFWKRLSDPGTKEGCQNDYVRRTYCHTNIKGIITDVGAPETPEYWNALFTAERRRPKPDARDNGW